MSMHLARALAAAAIASLLHACGDADSAQQRSSTPAILPGFAQQTSTNADARPPEIPYSPDTPRWVATVARRWPHDTMAFTQGLLVHDRRLLESTGIEGRSGVREVERATGRIIRRADLSAKEFGEGIAVLGGRLYQLTWKSGRGVVYDARTLAPLDSFSYEGEGWGLTTDGSVLYLSDGTSRVRVVDPNGFRVRRTIQVSEVGKPIYMLNELEWVRGELWANVYETNLVARIDPLTGHVLGWIDLSQVLSPRDSARVATRGGVANGIAFDQLTRRVLVTGKYWPIVAELDSVPGGR